MKTGDSDPLSPHSGLTVVVWSSIAATAFRWTEELAVQLSSLFLKPEAEGGFTVDCCTGSLFCFSFTSCVLQVVLSTEDLQCQDTCLWQGLVIALESSYVGHLG